MISPIQIPAGSPFPEPHSKPPDFDGRKVGRTRPEPAPTPSPRGLEPTSASPAAPGAGRLEELPRIEQITRIEGTLDPPV